jgi:hypothetical protein
VIYIQLTDNQHKCTVITFEKGVLINTGARKVIIYIAASVDGYIAKEDNRMFNIS